jgi:hypothetical protein
MRSVVFVVLLSVGVSMAHELELVAAPPDFVLIDSAQAERVRRVDGSKNLRNMSFVCQQLSSHCSCTDNDLFLSFLLDLH